MLMMLLSIPTEILLEIVSFLEKKEILSFRLVNRELRDVAFMEIRKRPFRYFFNFVCERASSCENDEKVTEELKALEYSVKSLKRLKRRLKIKKFMIPFLWKLEEEYFLKDNYIFENERYDDNSITRQFREKEKIRKKFQSLVRERRYENNVIFSSEEKISECESLVNRVLVRSVNSNHDHGDHFYSLNFESVFEIPPHYVIKSQCDQNTDRSRGYSILSSELGGDGTGTLAVSFPEYGDPSNYGGQVFSGTCKDSDNVFTGEIIHDIEQGTVRYVNEMKKDVIRIGFLPKKDDLSIFKREILEEMVLRLELKVLNAIDLGRFLMCLGCMFLEEFKT